MDDVLRWIRLRTGTRLHAPFQKRLVMKPEPSGDAPPRSRRTSTASTKHARRAASPRVQRKRLRPPRTGVEVPQVRPPAACSHCPPFESQIEALGDPGQAACAATVQPPMAAFRPKPTHTHVTNRQVSPTRAFSSCTGSDLAPPLSGGGARQGSTNPRPRTLSSSKRKML